ncbi:hypothetical protein [Devosia naphthalenivorans]|uniref:hypothetical protein n=1 Tax=Devosia naphthalenivorans TaxID=2082392 RepID=UPI001FE69D8C|nr:hypothetical protein [Devosia naphthalenivorans]
MTDEPATIEDDFIGLTTDIVAAYVSIILLRLLIYPSSSPIPMRHYAAWGPHPVPR